MGITNVVNSKSMKVEFYGLLCDSVWICNANAAAAAATATAAAAAATAAAAAAAQTLSFPEKISSLTHKTFSPEVTVSYPVKSNKWMEE